MRSQDAAIVLVMMVALVGALTLPLIRAWARRIEGRGPDAGLHDDIAQLRERVGELESVAARVPELEERLDFAERLLARSDVRERLPGA